MRCSAPGTRFRMTRLKDNDRFYRSRFFKHLKESLSVLYTFYIGGNYLRVRVIPKVLEEITLVQVGGISVADSLAEIDATHGSVTYNICPVASALSDPAYVSGFPGKTFVERETGLRAVNTHSVRSGYSYASLPGYGQYLRLQGIPRLIANLAAAGGEPVKQLDAFFSAVGNQLRCMPGGNSRYNKVNLLRDILQAAIYFPSHGFAARGIDRIDGTFKTRCLKPLDVAVGDTGSPCFGGNSGDRYRPWMKNIVECRFLLINYRFLKCQIFPPFKIAWQPQADVIFKSTSSLLAYIRRRTLSGDTTGIHRKRGRKPGSNMHTVVLAIHSTGIISHRIKTGYYLVFLTHHFQLVGDFDTSHRSETYGIGFCRVIFWS